MKIHSNVHKNIKRRERHTCFIKDCDKVYLYYCTLKKHLELSHKTENDILCIHFGKISFNVLVKHLLKDHSNFDFIAFKDMNEDILELNSQENLIQIDKTIEISINQSSTKAKTKDNTYITEKTENFLIINKAIKFSNCNINDYATNASQVNNKNSDLNINQQLMMLTSTLYSYQILQLRNALINNAYSFDNNHLDYK